MVGAILTTIFCCLIGGIISIVYASKVNTKLAQGDIDGARAASKTAKLWIIIRLVITLLTCGWGGAILGIISLIEGIIYLTKSDEEFQTIYVKGHKEWF